MQKTHHRTWPPFILIGLSFLIIVIFVVIGRPTEVKEDVDAVAVETVTVPTIEEYRVEIRRLFDEYAVTQDDQRMYDQLLAAVVPPESRESHLQLVIAFQELRDGQEVEGEARLALFEAQNNWLNE